MAALTTTSAAIVVTDTTQEATAMVTSRTGTTKYKAWRTAVLQRGLNAGIRRCPCKACNACKNGCGVILDYTKGKMPHSAEPDHIIPVARGGQDVLENGRVLCRRCNQSRGDGTRPVGPRRRRPPKVQSAWIEGSDRW